MSGLTKTDVVKITRKAKTGAVREALAELEERLGGMLTPREVLDEARDPKSPLHNSFEWNDQVGAEKYRLMQATLLIHSVNVEVLGKSQQKYLFAKVNVAKNPVRGYFPVERVMSEKELHNAVVMQAVREIEVAQEKYNRLKELQGVINTKKLKKVKDQIGA